MSRHRNMHNLDYDQEYDDYYGEYDDEDEYYEADEGNSEFALPADDAFAFEAPAIEYEFEAPVANKSRKLTKKQQEAADKAAVQAAKEAEAKAAQEQEQQISAAREQVANGTLDEVTFRVMFPGVRVKGLNTTAVKTEPTTIFEKKLPKINTDNLFGIDTSSSNSATTNNTVVVISPTIKIPKKYTASQQRARQAIIDKAVNDDTAKPHLSMVVIGHVDAGKSTLMGQFLFQSGAVDERTMRKYHKQAAELNKASFAFAWVLDDEDEERSRGVTVDVAVKHFETKTKSVTLLDAPGHRDFIPNMISGATQADACILVVPAVDAEFQDGFSQGGQTKEHAILARSLGVSQIVVAVSKMDQSLVDWDESRYQHILDTVVPFLLEIGFKKECIRTIPVSGWTGANLVKVQENGWYTGPSLQGLIDTFNVPERSAKAPVRFAVGDVYRAMSLGVAVAGRVLAGCICPGDKLLLMPAGLTVTVKSIEQQHTPVDVARAGDIVELGLGRVSDDIDTVLGAGNILCDPWNPIHMASRFKAQLITLDYKQPIVKGQSAILFTHTSNQPCTITRLYSILGKDKKVKQRKPRVLPRKCNAIVEVQTQKPVCLELFATHKSLGRFSLRRGDESIGVGVVTKLYPITTTVTSP